MSAADAGVLAADPTVELEEGALGSDAVASGAVPSETGRLEPAAGALDRDSEAHDARRSSRAKRARFTRSPSFGFAQARRDAIPHLRLGKYVRFDEADLEQWLQALKRRPK